MVATLSTFVGAFLFGAACSRRSMVREACEIFYFALVPWTFSIVSLALTYIKPGFKPDNSVYALSLAIPFFLLKRSALSPDSPSRASSGWSNLRALIRLFFSLSMGFFASTYLSSRFTADSLQHIAGATLFESTFSHFSDHFDTSQRGVFVLGLLAATGTDPAKSNFVFYSAAVHVLTVVALLRALLRHPSANGITPINKGVLLSFAFALFLAPAWLFAGIYVNAHFIISAVLTAVLISLVHATQAYERSSQRQLARFLVLMFIVLASARPEAGLILLCWIIPFLANCQMFLPRHALLGAVLWTLAVIVSFPSLSNLQSKDLFPLFGNYLALVGVGAISHFNLHRKRVPRIASFEVRAKVLYGGLLVLYIGLFMCLDHEIFLWSLYAILMNVRYGNWAISLFVILALIVAQITSNQTIHYFNKIYAALGLSLSLMFSVSVLRGSAFRVGFGDSFNRMLIHLFPALVYLAAISLQSVTTFTWATARRQKAAPTPERSIS